MRRAGHCCCGVRQRQHRDGGSGSGSSSTGGIARAQAEVKKFAANPPLTVSPLPSEPNTSTYAIQVNCTIPSCAPGAMKAAMDVLGWQFEEMPYDVSKGPSAVQQALTQAIAAKPDVIMLRCQLSRGNLSSAD